MAYRIAAYRGSGASTDRIAGMMERVAGNASSGLLGFILAPISA
jgi:hypothetical protein